MKTIKKIKKLYAIYIFNKKYQNCTSRIGRQGILLSVIENIESIAVNDFETLNYFRQKYNNSEL
jgi:hypothetical protein